MAGSIKNTFVLDASFVLSFLLNEGNNNVEKTILDYKEGKINLVSSSLLAYEVGNGLRTGVLRKRLTGSQAESLYKAFFEFEIPEESFNFPDVLKLALSKSISFYDASYINLAQTLSLKLLTLD